MAKDKKSFILYLDQKGLFEKLTNEQAGVLIKHIFSYVSDENPEADFITELAFESIKNQLKRDLKKFEEVKTKRSEAGKRSAELRALKKIQQNSTNSTSVKSVQQSSTNSTVNVNDNVNVNDIIKDKSSKSIDFNSLLDYFNTSFGKSSRVVNEKVKKSINARLKEGYTKEDFKKCIDNLKEDSWHIENNYKYCTLEFISRSDKLDKYTSIVKVNDGNDDYYNNVMKQINGK